MKSPTNDDLLLWDPSAGDVFDSNYGCISSMDHIDKFLDLKPTEYAISADDDNVMDWALALSFSSQVCR
jgi:hypothetical protein